MMPKGKGKQVRGFAIVDDSGEFCYYQFGPFIQFFDSRLNAKRDIKRVGYDMSDKKVVPVIIQYERLGR